MEYSIWDILQFGNFIQLDLCISDKIIDDLKIFDDSWSDYNPRTKIFRKGLCVLNETGHVGPGPALDSLKQYNMEHGTNWNETDFNKPTELYQSSVCLQNFLSKIINYCVRTHFIKLPPGGYFPPHRDHSFGLQNTFRLIVPIINVNPPNCRFILEDKTLWFEEKRMYFINTTRQHTLFNASAKSESIWLILNVILCKESIQFVINHLAQK